MIIISKEIKSSSTRKNNKNTIVQKKTYSKNINTNC